uniref:Uncharacterized protein n=1 Tax=Chlamydomonas leiostraca TaxID=1034604 RepID=A0A7S0R5R1_9CHLO|mmetsp:Transcript_14471/g.35969  ORF Transcript_14471/g.35969 Transcript_14471/m.35969 type:complete len:198 (+) Transcript_14471:106-699(+)|eukprot:CAMPEP_0202865006 /NCGR_PEP_ID=MMETSP1391-20130828/5092_1 /ASSEMBLY_ACC=CAM_ASM_000867 /TAXON_ID=1034604 /ORGANISM="Chlamydomonas leiostraca, Strain SAG 11-49" /LENGTH=197 /DNA_ID=CAMNT_0049544791 /DNA_START=92 /DNA_END=685 /DNA_ORIENTATION=-
MVFVVANNESLEQAFWKVEMMKGETSPTTGDKRKALHLLAKPGLPRAIRARVARVPVGQRHKIVKLGPGEKVKSPQSPHQEGMMSRGSGRMALGPWGGPFETHPEAVLAETLYMDPKGVMYQSLDAKDAARTVLAAQADAKASARALMQATACVAHRGEDAKLARVAKGQDRVRQGGRFDAARGVRTRKMMRVMQPR